MSEHIHPGADLSAHLDADQLNAFAEGALPDHERVQAIAHLAECSHCREVAFLAQEPALDAASQPSPSKESEPLPFWRRWLTPLPLTGAAAFACMVLALTLWHSHPAQLTPTAPEVAVANEPPSVTPPQPTLTPEESQRAQPTSRTRPESSAASHLRDEPKSAATGTPQITSSMAGMSSSATPKANLSAPSAVPIPSPNAAGTATANGSNAPEAQTKARREAVPSLQAQNGGADFRLRTAAPAPAPAAQSANSALHQLPITGREVNNLAILSAGAAVSDATAQGAVHHAPESAEGMSQVTGSVSDASGAVIPRASVTLRAIGSTATAQPMKNTVTDTGGRFSLSSLPPGKYDLEITSPGFTALSQQVDLQPNDIAQLRPVLSVGVSSETVEVAASSVSSAEISTDAVSLNKLEAGLPSKLPMASSVTSGDKTLAVDSAGTLFLRRGTHRWKRVKAQWPGKAIQLALTQYLQGEARAAKLSQKTAVTPLFQLTITGGAVWVSTDGEHWRPR